MQETQRLVFATDEEFEVFTIFKEQSRKTREDMVNKETTQVIGKMVIEFYNQGTDIHVSQYPLNKWFKK